jgi:hypothetical protein
MSQLMRALRETHRGPHAATDGVFSEEELAKTREVNSSYDMTWPYVLLRKFPTSLAREDDNKRVVWAPVWMRHYAQPTLVYAYDAEADVARKIDDALARYFTPLRGDYPYMFPSSARVEEHDFIPDMDDDWRFLVMTGVHDLLSRQIPKLSGFERACLLLQALLYAETLLMNNVGVNHWEFGVQLSGSGQFAGVPRLKLVRLDQITFWVPTDEQLEVFRARLRKYSLFSILKHHWGFGPNRSSGAVDEAHVTRALEWAMREADKNVDAMPTLTREILDAYATHPRAAAMRHFVLESQL